MDCACTVLSVRDRRCVDKCLQIRVSLAYDSNDFQHLASRRVAFIVFSLVPKIFISLTSRSAHFYSYSDGINFIHFCWMFEVMRYHSYVLLFCHLIRLKWADPKRLTQWAIIIFFIIRYWRRLSGCNAKSICSYALLTNWDHWTTVWTLPTADTRKTSIDESFSLQRRNAKATYFSRRLRFRCIIDLSR